MPTAYAGVLVALLGKKGRGRKDPGRRAVDWYKQNLAKLDKKILSSFVGVYDTLHVSMSYDGNPLASVVTAGL